MPTVIPVRMHYSMQDLWFNPNSTGARKGDHVVVSTERGTEFGLVTSDAFVASVDEVKGELKPVLRVADEADLAKAEELARKGDEAMPVFRSLVKESGLDMKPVGVEFLFGGEKAVFYFAAEDRVDFRELVRELASRFHQRVDMRQIGVRDEARLVGGYAPCGQELCCVRFGGQFEPVSIRMAKEQDLPLNSAKISGVCGRLMCCLRYEFEAYRDFKQRAPKKNAVIDTPLGKAKIVEYNTPRETLTLRLENGKSFTVALKDMTCSEGCRKRCAEQNSPLRPDTVTREALEALGTPEMAMQLAELDRAMDPNGGYAALDDSLLDSRRTPRRRSSGQRQAEQGGTQRAGGGRGRSNGGASPDDEGRQPRRRRPAAGGTPDAAQGQAQSRRPRGAQGRAEEAAGEEAQQPRRPRGGGMRPRRTPKTPAAAGDAPEKDARAKAQRRGGAAAADAGTPQPARRTRRHHTAGEDAPAAQQQATRRQRGAQDKGAPSEASEAPKRRRSHQPPAPDARTESSPERRQHGQQRRAHAGGAETGPRGGAAGTPEGEGSQGSRPTRRRRPGDKGGAGARGSSEGGPQA